MRRLAVLALVVPALTAAGCGDNGASGPLDEALHYLPENAPFAVVFDTNVEGRQYRTALKLAARFPGGDELRRQLETQLEQGGVDFDRDVKPLLGNPFVVGGADPGRLDDEGTFVGAIEVKDGGKLKRVVEKSGARARGHKNGADLYEAEDGDAFAVKDDALVVAGSRPVLERALERRDGDHTLTQDEFDSALGTLPEDALVRAYFNLESTLRASPNGRQATKVKWVRALRTLGLVAQAREDGVTMPFDLKTDPSTLRDDDLPLVTGDASPKLVQRPGELALGLRDVGHLVDFGIDAVRAIEGPAVDVGKLQLERQLGLDVEDDVIRQLRGDASVVVTPAGDYGLRADLKHPTAFKRTLAKLAGALPAAARILAGRTLELRTPKPGEDFYTLSQADGTSTVFGVSRGVLVVATDAASARRLAAASPTPVPGAKGSLVLSADAEELAKALLGDLSARFGPLGGLASNLFTKPLGRLTGSARTDKNGIRGTLKLKVE